MSKLLPFTWGDPGRRWLHGNLAWHEAAFGLFHLPLLLAGLVPILLGLWMVTEYRSPRV